MSLDKAHLCFWWRRGSDGFSRVNPRLISLIDQLITLGRTAESIRRLLASESDDSGNLGDLLKNFIKGSDR